MTCHRCRKHPGTMPAGRTWPGLEPRHICRGCDDELHLLIEGHDDGLVGIGEARAPRPDIGDGWHNVVCDRCGAGWVGRGGETCGWCVDRQAYAIDEQRHLLLTHELPDTDDTRFDDALQAWVARLAVAVRAGIITEAEAHAAIGSTRGREVA